MAAEVVWVPIDLTGGQDYSSIHAAFGFVVAAFLWLSIWILWTWGKMSGIRDADDRSRMLEIRHQLDQISGTVITIPRSDRDRIEDYRGRVETALRRSNPQGIDGQKGVLGTVRAAWHDRTESIPGLATVLLNEAIVIAGAYVLLIVPAAAIASGIATNDPLSPATVIQAITTGVTRVVDIAGLFPAGSILWSLVFVGIVTLYQVLFDHVLVVVAVLLTGTVVITRLDRRVPDDIDPVLYDDKPWLVSRIVGGAVIVWGVGAGLRTALFPVVPNVAGLVAGGGAWLCVMYLLYRGVRDLYWRVQGTDTQDGWTIITDPGDDTDVQAVVRYLLARKVWGTIAVLAFPVAVLYVGKAVASGKLVEIAVAFVEAPAIAKLIVVWSIVSAAWIIKATDSKGWRTFVRALSTSIGRQQIRLLFWGGLAPLVAMVVGSVFLVSLGFPWTWALVGGLVAAIGIRLAWSAYERVASRVRNVDVSHWTPPTIQIACGKIDAPDADHPIYIAKLGRHRLAWPHLTPLVDQVLADCRRMFTKGSPGPSVQRAYYRRLVDTGDTDPENARAELRGNAKEDFKRRVRPDGEDKDRVDEWLSTRYPDDILAEARAAELETTISEGDHQYHWHGPRET